MKPRAGMSKHLLTAIVTGACGLLFASPAEAFERTWHLGASGGYSLMSAEQGTARGFGGGMHLAYGLNDAINLRVQTDVFRYEFGEDPAAMLLFNGAAGAEYVFDTLDWLVYGGALLGAVDISAVGGADQLAMALELPLGLNYQFSQDWAVGVEAQYRLFVFKPEGGPTSTLHALLRFEYMWGGSER